jgi:hypothetical protein
MCEGVLLLAYCCGSHSVLAVELGGLLFDGVREGTHVRSMFYM